TAARALMKVALLLLMLGCLVGALLLFRRGLRQFGSENVMRRLHGEARPQKVVRGGRLERLLLRAGINMAPAMLLRWGAAWALLMLVGALLGGTTGLLLKLLLLPLLAWAVVSWRSRRRMQ